MKIFSPVLKRKLKECILAIFWPKKEIYAFFKNCSVPKQTLDKICDWDEKGYHRHNMVDVLFDALNDQADNGTLHFDQMLNALAEWDYFDPYWFDKEKKLDVHKAKEIISILKKAKKNEIDKAKKRNSKQRKKQDALKEHYDSLADMRNDFDLISLSSATNQKRGYAFEVFLLKMASFCDLKVTSSFKISGSQIDGTIKYEGENYNIEAKWHDRILSDEPIMAFCHKQEINMHGRGIFISINGVTEGTLNMLMRSNVKNTIIIDGEDITLILNEMITFPELLDKKIQAAQTRGLFYINPITGDSKIRV